MRRRYRQQEDRQYRQEGNQGGEEDGITHLTEAPRMTLSADLDRLPAGSGATPHNLFDIDHGVNNINAIPALPGPLR
jgi:hypothetical protein